MPEENPKREFHRKSEIQNRLMELYVWMIFAGIIAARPLYFAVTRPSFLIQIFNDYYFDIVFGIAAFFFPVIFKLIFGALPFESVRRQRAIKRANSDDFLRSVPTEPDWPQRTRDTAAILTADAPDKKSEELILDLITSSARLANKIYTRAGVYLLVGVLIAGSGLAFFYGRTISTKPSQDLAQHLLDLAPNFGILIFIEFIAFFFLKQYRAAMDEFRYYEAIQRHREENLAALKLLNEKAPTADAFKTLKAISIYSSAGKLSKGETTDLLEAKKIAGSDLDLVEKIIEILIKLKK